MYVHGSAQSEHVLLHYALYTMCMSVVIFFTELARYAYTAHTYFYSLVCTSFLLIAENMNFPCSLYPDKVEWLCGQNLNSLFNRMRCYATSVYFLLVRKILHHSHRLDNEWPLSEYRIGLLIFQRRVTVIKQTVLLI
jgi:hypothetical protein